MVALANSVASHADETTMRAAVITAPGTLDIIHSPIPDPKPDEVRIRVEHCGVCASNLARWEGRSWFHYPSEPGELGHEGIGIISALGDSVSIWKIGQRVAFLSNHAYADFDVARSDGMIPIPDIFNGTPFLGEPLGCAYNIFKRSAIRPSDTVAIIGIGFLGALLTQLITNQGAHVLAIAHRSFSQIIAQTMGASEVIAMSGVHKTIGEVVRATHGQLCDVVIEATGKQVCLDIASQITKERGRLVIAGYHQVKSRRIDMQTWNWRGIDVVNAHERNPSIYIDGMRHALEATQSGVLDSSPLITHYFPLEQLGFALDMTKQRPNGFLKAVITL